MNHRAKAARYDDERWTMMSWMKHNKLAKTISASILAVGICFGTTAVASAEIHYPVSGSSFDYGQYRGSWKATPTYSKVSAYSFSNSNFCDAVQDGNHHSAIVSNGVYCSVDNSGSQNAHNHWVEFYMM